MNRLGMFAVGLGVMVAAGAAGCRPSPECYGADECDPGQQCLAGTCGVPDAGTIDAGMFVPTWFEVVSPIVQQNCWGNGQCHVRPLPIGIPMPLVDYQDVQALSTQGDLVYQRMSQRVADLQAPMPPRGQSQLNAQQIRFIQNWAAAGAPPGDPANAPDAGPIGGNNNNNNAGGQDGGGVVNNGPLAGAGVPEQVATGYGGLASPVWGDAVGVLVMTDITQDTIFFSMPPAPFEPFLTPSNGAVGLAGDEQGNLLITFYAARQVGRVVGQNVNPAATDFNGQLFNGPHAVTARSDGTLYFTDPEFAGNPNQIGFNGVFRVPPGGAAVAEWQGLPGSGPAGIALSPDETALYVTDRVDGVIRRWDVNADGSLANETQLTTTALNPDGIAVDVNGNLYVATNIGVQAFAPDGTEWGALAIPEAATGVGFGDPDRRALYVTSATTLYRIPMQVTGAP